jgi:hypothetical protein
VWELLGSRGNTASRGAESRSTPYPQLIREIRALGYSATGRRYGVTDNAIRKWVRAYEREQQRAKEAA